MRILGIDPGTRITGYGLIEVRGSRSIPVAHGKIANSASLPLSKCFRNIYRQLRVVIDSHKPQAVAIENVFYCKNVNSAIKLGEARGVAILAAAESDLEIFEYMPRKVKQAVVGQGGADKIQVLKMVKMLLGLKEDIESVDASDALAVALCHAHTIKGSLMIAQSGLKQKASNRL
ncbi:crossover junction endodeoxyribonuclease RuvC [Candidatus Auribacterota bacterium]